MYSSHVAHVHGNALTCSIPSMVEGSPSRTAHVWLMCTVMPSRIISSMVEGSPSRVAHMHGNALTCSISSMVEGSPSRTAHVHGNAFTCGTYSRVGRATKVKFFTP